MDSTVLVVKAQLLVTESAAWAVLVASAAGVMRDGSAMGVVDGSVNEA